MLTATTGARAAFLTLIFSFIGAIPVHSQNTSSLTAAKSQNARINASVWMARCETSPPDLTSAWRPNRASEWPTADYGLSDTFTVLHAMTAECVEEPRLLAPRSSSDQPCSRNSANVPGMPPTFPCDLLNEAIPANLIALGKEGAKIARARLAVLNILRSHNACSEWFETKDVHPGETFDSLGFILDPLGPRDILESPEVQAVVTFRQPYVARATQDGGLGTAIIINQNGAFFRTQGQVQKVALEGGPAELRGTRLLTVGSFTGDRLPAQMVTLLHELGHIIDLLPEDADNLDGKSVRNTDEVLRHCRSEIEMQAQRAKQASK